MEERESPRSEGMEPVSTMRWLRVAIQGSFCRRGSTNIDGSGILISLIARIRHLHHFCVPLSRRPVTICNDIRYWP